MRELDEREMQKTTKEKQTTAERCKGNRSYSESTLKKYLDCKSSSNQN